jgi:c-di-GMP-binding flagellar brake protein YcgR
MQGAPGIDFPEDRSPVDVLAASRGDAVMCFVEEIKDDELVLTVGQDRSGRPVRLQPGERLELVWKDGGELRSLPAELTGIDTAPLARWRISPAGPAARGQRRAAVRAALPFRAVLEHGDVTAEGTTLDVSEGGIRAWFDLSTVASPEGDAAPAPVDGPAEEAADPRAPELGAVVTLTVWFDDRQRVTSQAEVTRHHDRSDRRTELSLRFIGLPEKMQDLVRREVFAGLRDLRARGLL